MIVPAGVLFDLDGVIYQGGNLIDGAIATLNFLDNIGVPYRFITNTTRMTKLSLVSSLEKMGFKTIPERVFASPHAAIEYCKAKGLKRILLIVPDPEMKSDFSYFELVDENPEVIVLGDMGPMFSFELMNRLFKNMMDGSHLVALHKNRYWLSEDGLTIDLGAFVAALEYASGKTAAIMGKPNPNIFNLAAKGWDVPHESVFMVGDDIEADICGAKNAGMKSVLVKTGKYCENVLVHSKIKPDHIIESVADLPALFKLN